uniref:Chloride channel CLIC-like protein 1 n=1 Tax=Caenorhabditis tropicalis TaxID=1561998 RepID=A0A1I7T9C1_9PELO
MKLLWLILLFGNCVNSQDDTQPDVWRDPNDPTREQRPAKSKSLLAVPPPVQKPDQSLRLILRQLLQDIQVDYQINGPVQRNVQIKISTHSMSVLSKYLNDDDADLPDDREAVRSALSKIFKVLEAAPDPTWLDTFMSLQPFVFTLNLILLPAAAVVVIRSFVRPRNFWILVVSTILIISMYSGYNRKYQEAESRRFAQFQEMSSDACAPEGLLSRMVEIFASPFQYRQKSKCLKYIESQTISIFHEISIIEVFSETISSGFFAFLSASAKHLNRFFRDLYDGAPLIAQIVMTFFIILMVGTVRTPFFSYEPIWLTFCSSSIGKIAGWLEGVEPENRKPSIQLNLTTKEVKRLEQAKKKKAAMIEYPKSEKEEGGSGSESGKKRKNEKKKGMDSTKKGDDSVHVDTQAEDDLSLLGESSEDEEEISDVKNKHLIHHRYRKPASDDLNQCERSTRSNCYHLFVQSIYDHLCISPFYF